MKKSDTEATSSKNGSESNLHETLAGIRIQAQAHIETTTQDVMKELSSEEQQDVGVKIFILATQRDHVVPQVEEALAKAQDESLPPAELRQWRGATMFLITVYELLNEQLNALLNPASAVEKEEETEETGIGFSM